MRRVPFWWFAAVIVALGGIAGLARGAVPQAAAAGGATDNSPPMVVTGAYIRVPVSPDLVAVYFTVYNTTAQPDTLEAATSGAGAVAALHSGPNMEVVGGGGVVVPAHGSLSFSPSAGHVMISNLYSPLEVGQSVDVELQFANAGTVVFSAPVIGVYAPTPGASVTASVVPSTASASASASTSAGATK